MILPMTPRVGGEIEISYLRETGKYYRGYGHEVIPSYQWYNTGDST